MPRSSASLPSSAPFDFRSFEPFDPSELQRAFLNVADRLMQRVLAGETVVFGPLPDGSFEVYQRRCPRGGFDATSALEL